ncbi:MAG: hypothetical protein JW934_13810 [Anaerolineae bacterium]|nr:hypothetical protein [Anaerolineae bacterium]
MLTLQTKNLKKLSFRCTQLLSQQTIQEISKSLAGLANGSVQSGRTIEFLSDQFTKRYRRPSNFSINKSNPIKEIRHDCGGASAVAWLAMTISHLGTSSSWEIYEEYSRYTGVISTISSCIDASGVYSLSNYLYRLLLENLYILRTPPQEGSVVSPVFEKQSSLQEIAPIAASGPVNETSSSVEGDLSQKEMEHYREPSASRTPPTFSSENAPQKHSRSFPLPENQKVYPPDSHIVSIDGLYGNELSLIEIKQGYQYRISSKNLISLVDCSNYYEFIIIQWLFWLFEKKIRLVLPKNGLMERQVKDINQFYSIVTSSSDRFMR